MSTDTLNDAVRRYVYDHFVKQKRPPLAIEVAEALQISVNDAKTAFNRLHDDRVLVLEPDRLQIRFAEPFCAVPTRFRVYAQGKSWWGTCAWDALGIPAALHADAEIVSACPDCGEPIHVLVKNGRVNGSNEIIHFAIPANRWWDDINFT
jgi:hypothetical protein